MRARKAEQASSDTKVFYWPDTGPVECRLDPKTNLIVEAKTAEGVIVQLPSGDKTPALPMMWVGTEPMKP